MAELTSAAQTARRTGLSQQAGNSSALQRAGLYRARGWTGTIPLRAGTKKPPPTGWTGYDAAYPSAADVQAWLDDPDYAGGNLGLRLPGTVLGVDVDDYDGKAGGATFAEAEARLGPLPPAPISTSRDGISGIRLFRVPPGRCWADTLGPDVEIIHHGHRYLVAWPSTHPEGRRYMWLTVAGAPARVPPRVDDLPELPPSWVAALDRGPVSDRQVKREVNGPEVAAFLTGLPDGPECGVLRQRTDRAVAELAAGGSRHDTMRNHQLALLGAGNAGHRGARHALERLRVAFDRAVADPTREAQPREWADALAGAVAALTPTPSALRHCCPTVPDDPGLEVDQRLAFEVDRLRLRRDARRLLDAEEAARLEIPPFDAGLLGDILDRPPEPPFRVDDLLPSGGRLLVVAQRKVGKTVWQLNLARSLIFGDLFLDAFQARPITGTVAILNYEVTGRQLAAWARDVAIPRDRLLLVNLRGRRNPLTFDADRVRLVDLLKAHQVEVVMIDPFGRAYDGKSQNDPGEVAAWLARLDQLLDEVGAAEAALIVHAGWDGERSRGASSLEDWGDAIVTLTLYKDDHHGPRFLRAIGRDVDVVEDELAFDPRTRRLTLTGAGSRKKKAKAVELDDLLDAAVAIVASAPGQLNVSQLRAALRNNGHALQKGDESRVVANGEQARRLRTEPGKRGAKLLYPGQLPRPTPDPPHGAPPDPPQLPPIGERGVGQVDSGSSDPWGTSWPAGTEGEAATP